MDVSVQPLHIYSDMSPSFRMLFGTKQIPSFLLSYNRLKGFFFFPGRVEEFESCLYGVRNLNQNCQVFSAK